MPAKAKADGAVRERWDVWTQVRPLPGGWITLGEAASDLGISREAVHRLVQRGTLDARRVGRRPDILVKEKDVKELPMSPQRRRELELREADSANLGDELPDG